ncbi:hypothetical protein METBIDRAFT_9463 [Metschnikowia bicuspidata var. bicuspidata NRRL YB-4993]|uniref:Uncharacterized protein n=1 Tax=Metschnikowia bicuspidata var. bicuspidata NRRL YB-4993 TaxID=869754 RepID=A0A1A0HH40_9ASCO|nr:hypothetical protein METBIDRAFT_9463 [Metschnikowia bicuspidata var. bicuspidata NRRL YB-4993]OBA23163.1 hypothetical protein METBIDRAFT_9463 [Metschnikowia bicuspidata var. bicuspidata NRRL YB-4993]
MAKKVSKHSRAARRGEIDVGGEAKALENLPRDENDDVRKHIIRTTIKNENLLAKKMELEKVKKKGNKKLSHTFKHKTEKNSRLEGVLAGKIQQSIEKARYVQTARKSGWDQINKSIVIRTDLTEAPAEKAGEAVSEKEAQQKEEDEYVKLFFGDQATTEEPPQDEAPVAKPKPSGNIFDMLEETDC